MDIKQLRELAGGLPNLTDEQIVETVYEVYKPRYPDFQTFAKSVGYDPEWDFGRGLRMGGRGVLGALGGAAATAADVLGAEGVRDRALEFQQGQQREAFRLGRRVDDVDNFAEDPLSWLSSAAGQATAYAVPSLVGGGVGGLAARAFLGAGRGLAGAAAGAYAANTAQEVGSIYGDLAEQGRYEPGRALAFGAAAGALDTAAEAVPFLGAARRGRFLTRAAKTAGIQAPVEAATETAQTVIERAGAGKSLTDEEAWHEYRNAAALGAVGGGMFGAAFGGLRRDTRHDLRRDLLNPQQETAPAQLPWDGYFQKDQGQAPFYTFPDGSTATSADMALAHRYGLTPEDILGAARGAPPADAAPPAGGGGTPATDMADEAVRARAIERTGNKGRKAVDLYGQLERLQAAGLIVEEDFDDNVNTLAQHKYPLVEAFIRGVRNAQLNVSGAAPVAAGAADVRGSQPAGSSGDMGSVAADARRGLADPAAAAVVGGAAAAPVGDAARGLGPDAVTPPARTDAPGNVASPTLDPVQRRRMTDTQLEPHARALLDRAGIDPGRKRTVKRKQGGRMVDSQRTALQLTIDMMRADDYDTALVEGVTGINFVDGTISEPLTLDQAVEYAASQSGKRISKQAAQVRLAKYGIDADTVTRVAAAGVGDTVTEAELGLGQQGEDAGALPGFRVEETLSDAAGAGLVDAAVTDSKLNRRARATEEQMRRDNPELAARMLGTEQGRLDKSSADAAAVAQRLEAPTTGEDPQFVRKRELAAQIARERAAAAVEAPRAATVEEFLSADVQRGNIASVDIADAAELWNDENDGTLPAFSDLDVDLQAAWVRAYHHGRSTGELQGKVADEQAQRTARRGTNRPDPAGDAPRVGAARSPAAAPAAAQAGADQAAGQVLRTDATEDLTAAPPGRAVKSVQAADTADPNAANVSRQESELIDADYLVTASEATNESPVAAKLLSAKIERLALAGSPVVLRSATVARAALAAAVMSLEKSPFGTLFSRVWQMTGGLVQISGGPTDPETGIPTYDASNIAGVALLDRPSAPIAVPGNFAGLRAAATFRGDRTHAATLASTVAHETVHVLEHRLQIPTTDRQHHVTESSVGPVAQEVIDAYKRLLDDGSSIADMEMERLLAYALTRYLDDLPDGAEHADVELLPVLTQVRLEYSALMRRRMPLAWQYVTDILSYSGPVGLAHLEAARVIRGKGAPNAGTGQAAAGTGSAVPRAVRRNSVGLAPHAGGGVPRNAAAQPAGRKTAGPVAGKQDGAATQRADGGLASLPPPPPKIGGLRGFVDSLFKDGLWRTYPNLLGWMTGEQLGERFKDLPMVRKFSEVSSRMAGRATQILAASDKLKRRWEALKADDARILNDLLIDATSLRAWPDEEFGTGRNAHLEDTDANRAAHAALANAWKRAPSEVQSLFTDVIADFETRHKAKVAAVRSGLVSTYYPDADSDGLGLTREEVDALAKAGGTARKDLVARYSTTARRAREIRSLVNDLDQHDDTFKRMPGPYFPLMRFGKHVVSIKSQALREAEAELAAAQKALRDAENEAPADADLKTQSDEVKRAATVLNNLRRNEDDYRVEFYETLGEARARAEQARAALGSGYEVNQSIKDEYLRSVDATSPTFMKRLENKLGQHLEGKQAETIKQAVREMYVQMLPETSMLKSQLKRRDVAGASRDALRTFAASAVRDAHGISRLEYQEPLRDALDRLRFERGNIDAKIVGQELARRLQQNFAFVEAPVLSGLSNVTYLTYLGLSPSFLVTQLTQPWAISAPVLAARHHMKSFGALREAMTAAGSMLYKDAKGQKTAHFSFDPDRALRAGQITADEAVMLQSLLDSGHIDITITQDMGATSQGKDATWLSKLTTVSAVPAQQLEVMNRVGTALAAYRLQKQLELSRGVDNPTALENAQRYASDVVSQTHLNYAAENRARYMHPNTWGGWGRILWQFRSYQQGMVYLVLKNMIDWSRGDAEARRASAYLAGTMLAAAGTTGLPGAAVMTFVAQALYNAFTDDDDEKDVRQMMYAGVEGVVGQRAANAMIKGLPTLVGVDASGRIGMGDIFSPAPYADDRAEGRDLVSAYWIAMTGGAFFGAVQNWAEAIRLVDEGKLARAAQAAFPKVLADQVRWMRETTDGVTDSRGRVLVAPEERGVGDAAVRALGFATPGDSRMRERRAAFFEARENRDAARQALLTEFAQVRLKGKPVTGVIEKINEFNARHPDARITPANREAAVRGTRDRAKEMRGGVPVRKRDQALADSLGV